MARLGVFDTQIEPKAWFDNQTLPEGWFTDELIPEPLPPPPPPPPPVTGGGGPGNARGRQRPVYMVDDKVFDSPAAAARYLASVTLPEPAPEAPRAAPKPKPRLAVQVAGEQVAVAPRIPVTATTEYTRELIQAELIQARRALQRRQREADEEERAAVFAVVQMLLEDGETVTFH